MCGYTNSVDVATVSPQLLQQEPKVVDPADAPVEAEVSAFIRGVAGKTLAMSRNGRTAVDEAGEPRVKLKCCLSPLLLWNIN